MCGGIQLKWILGQILTTSDPNLVMRAKSILTSSYSGQSGFSYLAYLLGFTVDYLDQSLIQKLLIN
jgi:hypothetical protein